MNRRIEKPHRTLPRASEPKRAVLQDIKVYDHQASYDAWRNSRENPKAQTKTLKKPPPPSHPPILSTEKLLKLVQDFNPHEKGEFAWKYHCRHLKKGQTQFWYNFVPNEKYGGANIGFVPLQYTSLVPENTAKSRIKRKTTAMVLAKGTQGIHFAIGWVELYNLIINNGVFATSHHDDESHPQLVEFRPPPLDPNAKGKSAPIMTSLLCESKKPRKAAQGKKKYTATPNPKENEETVNDNTGPTFAVKRKAVDTELVLQGKTKTTKKASNDKEDSDKPVEKPSKEEAPSLTPENENDEPSPSSDYYFSDDASAPFSVGPPSGAFGTPPSAAVRYGLRVMAGLSVDEHPQIDVL